MREVIHRRGAEDAEKEEVRGSKRKARRRQEKDKFLCEPLRPLRLCGEGIF
jgi:hypothetical protein